MQNIIQSLIQIHVFFTYILLVLVLAIAFFAFISNKDTYKKALIVRKILISFYSTMAIVFLTGLNRWLFFIDYSSIYIVLFMIAGFFHILVLNIKLTKKAKKATIRAYKEQCDFLYFGKYVSITNLLVLSIIFGYFKIFL